jgi:hypothetical protein
MPTGRPEDGAAAAWRGVGASAYTTSVREALRPLEKRVESVGRTARLDLSSDRLGAGPRSISASRTASDSVVASTQRMLERTLHDLHTAQRQVIEAEAAAEAAAEEAARWQQYAEGLERELVDRDREPIPTAAEDEPLLVAYDRAARAVAVEYEDAVPPTAALMMDFLTDRLVDLRAGAEQLALADKEKALLSARLEEIAAEWEEREATLLRQVADSSAAATSNSPKKPLFDQLRMGDLFAAMHAVATLPEPPAATTAARDGPRPASRPALEEMMDGVEASLANMQRRQRASRESTVHAQQRAEALQAELETTRAELQAHRRRSAETSALAAQERAARALIDDLRRELDEAREALEIKATQLQGALDEVDILMRTHRTDADGSRSSGSVTPEAATLRQPESIIDSTLLARAVSAAQSQSLPPLQRFDDITTWGFNSVEANRDLAPGSGGILYQVGMQAAEALHIDDLPRETLGRFLLAAAAMYGDVPYHNEEHAADVVQSTAAMLLMVPPLLEAIPMEERLAVLVAAAGHDVGHPGRNNNFMVNTRDALAVRYNDRCVLENHHAACTVELATQHFDVTAGLTAAQAARFRAVVTTLVLGTDMAHHRRCVADLEAVAQAGITAAHLDDPAQRLELISAVMHAADISNSAKPSRDSVLLWTDRVMEEFAAQGAEEIARGLPVSPGCGANPDLPKAQLFFIDVLCLPLYRALAAALGIKALVASLVENRSQWAVQAGCSVDLPRSAVMLSIESQPSVHPAHFDPVPYQESMALVSQYQDLVLALLQASGHNGVGASP